MRKAIAIDFDGCLCEWAWPEIGAPHMEVINAAIREKESGAALILWTCRVGSLLESAVEWCSSYGLEFDAVNANLPERITAYRNDCRKVNADEYWDDHAIRMGAGREYWRNTVLVDAVQTWGAEAQQQMMIEEMSELTKALCKLYRARTEADAEAVIANIREEMADVQIMLDQMKILFGGIEEQESGKLERLASRLSEAHRRKLDKDAHCRECICRSCDLFQKDGCLEGADHYVTKCDHESHTRACPWHPNERGGRA